MLDLDGVIYNWLKSGLKLFNIDPEIEKNRVLLKTYHDSLEMIRNKHEVFDAVESAGSDFWSNLELLPWGLELYDSLTKLGNVTILTSPGLWTYAGQGKQIALKRDFGIKSFILAKEKHICARPNAILIDDKKKNVTNFRKAGGWSYLWPNQFCIQDEQPNINTAMHYCLEYVKHVRSTIANRKVNEIINVLSSDNLREEELIEQQGLFV